MAHAHRSPAGPRRAMVLALLATTAVAALLGGCTQTGLPFARSSNETKLSAPEAIGAISQWSAAYAKKPQDPKMALGYAMALKAIGSRDRALDILIAGYRANPDNAEIAAELGRLALDMGRLDIARQTLKVAEAQGVRDWKTLSAQGTLRAKQGQHAEAQQYYLAALQEQPDAVSVINNLALSYALDGKADKSEELLRKAVASGHDDKRVRQNLALVLGLQGKFEEARQVASVDITDQEAKSNLSYLRNMLSSPTRMAAAKPGADDDAGDEWQPFAAKDASDDTPSKSADATPVAAPKVQVVKATEKIEAPSAATPVKAAQAASAAAPAKLGKVAGTPTLITPVKATPAQVQAATPAKAAQSGTSVKAKAIPAAASADAAGLLRTDTD
ncbi:MAG: tetratricopeptide repeat protein [Methyloceanibacter sp.]